MNKKLTIFEDGGNIKDNASLKGTSVILRETGSGKVLFRGSNKVIVSGSEFNAIKDFDFDGFKMEDNNGFLSSIPSYDEAFKAASKPFRYKAGTNTPIGVADIAASTGLSFYTGANDSVLASIVPSLTFSNVNHQKLYQYFSRRVCLWCLGIDGCGVEASRVFKVHNTKWIAPYGPYQHYNDGTGGNNTYDTVETALIPFKYRTSDADLDSTRREQYFGRTEVNTNVLGYFFKAFDEKPALIRRYADDSSFLSNVDNVWADKRASEAEVVVQLKLSVSATDCREYFQKLIGVNDSKVNTISLCTAVPYVRDGEALEYLDIRPFTKFNFPNEALIDNSKGIDITYYLYY